LARPQSRRRRQPCRESGDSVLWGI
jgi:hypothetical protein